MNSNLENPLQFFDSINEIELENHIIDRLINHYDAPWYSIALPTEIRYTDTDEDGQHIDEISTVTNFIHPLLREEFENSKRLLRENGLKQDDEYNKRFLRFQFNTLQALIRNKSEFINTYPYFLFPIRGLVRFINERLLDEGMEQFTLNEDGIKSAVEDSLIPVENDKIIDSVLSYMKGENRKQELILNSEDFQLLMEYTSHLVTEDKVPSIERQLAPKLTAGEISFTFWVLHYELYTTENIRESFCEFLKAVFDCFKKSEIKSIRNQFGNKQRALRGRSFFPEIIKDRLAKSTH